MTQVRRARNRRGFSLLEMIVVLTILAAIAGAVAPAMQRGVAEDELQETTRQFTSLYDRAYRTAVSRSVAVTLSIDVGNRRYWVVAAEPRGDTVVANGLLSLQPGERLEAAVPRLTIRFGPTGGVTLADAVVLRGPANAVSLTSISWRGSPSQ